MDLHEMLLASKISGKNNENADLSDYYTKSQTDDLISGKVDKEDGKGLSSNDFTNEYKQKINSAAPQSTTYTKTETDQRITTKVAEIVSNAPEDFDTLKEISDWIENHENSAAAMNSAIVTNTTAIDTKADKATTYTKTEVNSVIDNKVDKVLGKGLSTNDFTNTEKLKLSGLENYDDTEIKTDVANIANQIDLNRNTLGYQRKNLLMNNCKNIIMHGVTGTVNADKSISLSGSNTYGKSFLLYVNLQTGETDQYVDNKKFLPNGKYILSGSKSGVSVQVRLAEIEKSEGTLVSSSDGVETTFTVTDAYKYVWSRILIKDNADFGDGITIYPMIYKPSVEERLTALENAILGGISND